MYITFKRLCVSKVYLVKVDFQFVCLSRFCRVKIELGDCDTIKKQFPDKHQARVALGPQNLSGRPCVDCYEMLEMCESHDRSAWYISLTITWSVARSINCPIPMVKYN